MDEEGTDRSPRDAHGRPERLGLPPHRKYVLAKRVRDHTGILFDAAIEGDIDHRGNKRITQGPSQFGTVALGQAQARALPPLVAGRHTQRRSEQRRVGKEGVGSVRSRWSAELYKK